MAEKTRRACLILLDLGLKTSATLERQIRTLGMAGGLDAPHEPRTAK